jgi:hypothetical protein
MQLCNSGREFKTIFLVPVGAECKLRKQPKFGHFGLMTFALTPNGWMPVRFADRQGSHGDH